MKPRVIFKIFNSGKKDDHLDSCESRVLKAPGSTSLCPCVVGLCKSKKGPEEGALIE